MSTLWHVKSLELCVWLQLLSAQLHLLSPTGDLPRRKIYRVCHGGQLVVMVVRAMGACGHGRDGHEDGHAAVRLCGRGMCKSELR